ncbi:MAG: hypothetical protein Q6373_005925 [Candidatus Sigynarchaeota archaeon]
MSTKRSSLKAGYAGVLVASIAISFLLGYFVIPMLPARVIPSGTIRQTRVVTSQTLAYLTDSSTTYSAIPDMSLEITIADKSSVQAVLSSGITIYLNETFSGITLYNIALVITGVGNRTVAVEYISYKPISSSIKIAESFYLDYHAGPLAAGTYLVTAYWKSLVAPTTGYTQISMTTNVYNYTRSLTVCEISG